MKYTCMIEVDDIVPKIWRKFQFDPEVTFHQLHQIIQIVMGWENCHLYQFHVNGQAVGLPDPTFAESKERQALNARREKVCDYIKPDTETFTYIYDFGDDWIHTVTMDTVEHSDLPASEDPAPVCLGGSRCCPPEDIGGVPGYSHMIEALTVSDHPDRGHFLEWLGEGYDPERFSADEVNDSLRKRRNKLVPRMLAGHPDDAKPVKLTKSALNKHLKQMSRDELVELVKECYGASKEMEKFLAVRIIGNEAVESLFHEYRKKVVQEFFPERGTAKLRLQEAKKAIAEFDRLTGSDGYSLELKLIYVETGLAFTRAYGNIDERFYQSVALMYADIIQTVNDDETAELFDDYEERIAAVVTDTKGVGWGLHEYLGEMHAALRWI